MSIEVICSKCNSALRVDDEHAGKKARCPQCQEILPIPAASPNPAASAPPVAGPSFQSGATQAPSATQAPGANPYTTPQQAAPFQPYVDPYAGLTAHRGEMVLMMGLLSLLVCPLLGFFPISMANKDLRLIDGGRMNPTGRGMVVAGKVLGWISVCILLLYVLMFGGIFLFAILAANA